MIAGRAAPRDSQMGHEASVTSLDSGRMGKSAGCATVKGRLASAKLPNGSSGPIYALRYRIVAPGSSVDESLFASGKVGARPFAACATLCRCTAMHACAPLSLTDAGAPPHAQTPRRPFCCHMSVYIG